MTRLRIWASRLRGLFSIRRGDERLTEEIASHLEFLTADYIRRGMTPEQAAREARRQLGGITQIAEEYREQRSLPLASSVGQDLRYAVRQLRANPGFAAVAVLTLALGIGANTAIFRVLDAVLLRSLPVRDPEQLVLIQNKGRQLSFNYPLYRDVAARQQVVEGMFADTDFPVNEVTLANNTPLANVKGRLVTGSYFPVLGVAPRLGRLLAQDDDKAGVAPVAVISYGFWQRTFGGEPSALGQTLRVNQTAVTIVGVTPHGFFGERVGSAPDVWLPINLAPNVWVDLGPGMSILPVMARLRSDIPMRQAEAALDLLQRQLRNFTPGRPESDYRLELAPGSQGFRELQNRFSAPLKVLMSIVGLVLLIACSNLANLLLARATARTHEMGVRLALGAGRRRLIRQLLTESLLLAGVGSALGFALAEWGSRELVALASGPSPWRLALESGWRVPAFTAAIATLATCIFGLAPALAATRMDILPALQASRRVHTGSRSGSTATRVFVVAQVAISLLLVAGASLLVKSFWNLLHQDYGFRQEGVLMVEVPFNFTFRQTLPLIEPMHQRLSGLPGVESAALSVAGPLAGINMSGRVSLPERPSQADDNINGVSVTPGYFETMGIDVLAGRSITADDRANAPRVAVLSETAARRVFGKANPVGQTVTLGRRFDSQSTAQIVGVVRDVRFSGPRDPFGALVYMPFAQNPGPITSIVLRTELKPAALAGPVRQALRETVPNLRINDVQPLERFLVDRVRQERMLALLSGAFGLLALVLVSVGLYGVIAYGVERRTQEIGVRLALGARGRQVTALLLREVILVLAIGLGLGGACAIALGRWLRSLLFGLSPYDPAMLLLAAALLGSVAVTAGYLPARRAASLDPTAALRQE